MGGARSNPAARASWLDAVEAVEKLCGRAHLNPQNPFLPLRSLGAAARRHSRNACVSAACASQQPLATTWLS
jgi:hypothetical protein